MPELDHICPHCGAPMENRSFMRVCAFCGYCEVMSGKLPNQERVVTIIPESIYVHCIKNFQYINKYCKVKTDNDNSVITLTSKGFFAPKNRMCLHPSIHFYFQAFVNRTSYQLYLCTNVEDVENPPLFIKTSSGSIISPKPQNNNGHWQYCLTAEELSLICSSKGISIDCPFSLMEYDNLEELIIYSQRFYNVLVDRSKYQYAQNRFLLCDNL